jgi:hypothetical protein
MAKPIISNNGLDPLKDLVNTGITIIVHEKDGDVTSPLFIKNDGSRWYLNSKLKLTKLCDPFDVAPPAEADTTGKSCETPMNVKDCDRQALIDLLTQIYESVDDLELNTENINLNAEQINLNTDEVEQLLEDIKIILTPIPVENKTYQITLGQTINFNSDSLFGWSAGVYNGTASYEEGAGLTGPYNVGDSFGNGDSTNRIKNLNPITIITDTNGDVRISVLQVPGYNPTII